MGFIRNLAHDINVVHSHTEEITTQRIVAIVKAANTLSQESVSIKQERAELDAVRLKRQKIEEELRKYELLKGKYKLLSWGFFFSKRNDQKNNIIHKVC